ncbi:hypothetical protein [Actinomyces ruminis]|uniref:hypothetical protein n=1 Tax=Actinomyces ruminis TaxID=1937003 RepID=UPI0030B8233C
MPGLATCAWWAWALVGCALGLGAELMQWALPELDRRPSLYNVVQNGVGAWLGAALAGLLSHRRRSSGAGSRRV